MRARAWGVAIGVAVAVAGAAAPGCTQTVKTTQKRVVTAEDAAAVEKERRERREKDDREQPPAPKKPATLDEEAARLRGEIEKEPQNPKWQFLLGRVYEMQASKGEREQPAAARGLLELAETRYRRGAELIPPDQYTGPHYYLGRVLFKQQKWGAAHAELKKAVAVKPPDPEGYYLNPDYRESHYLLGAVLHRAGELDEAERNFRLFLKYGGEVSRVVDFFPELVAE